MIKATAGGGGRGMRAANDIDELISGISITQQEAKNAFGNETLYLGIKFHFQKHFLLLAE